MIQLAAKLQKKYVIVDIGTLVLVGPNVVLRCALCGNIITGATQQIQVNKLFQCLETHMAPDDVYEVYEQRGTQIYTSINKVAWDRAKKRTKYKSHIIPGSPPGKKGG